VWLAAGAGTHLSGLETEKEKARGSSSASLKPDAIDITNPKSDRHSQTRVCLLPSLE
jgi:hypothetical protein